MAVTLKNSAKAAYGTVLRIGATPVAIADITSLSPSVDVNEAEVTNIDSADGFQEFIPTTKGMEISFDFNYNPADHTTKFFDAITAGTVHNPMSILWSTAGGTHAWTFAGFIRNASIDGATDGALQGSGTIRVTGTIDFND